MKNEWKYSLSATLPRWTRSDGVTVEQTVGTFNTARPWWAFGGPKQKWFPKAWRFKTDLAAMKRIDKRVPLAK